MMARIGRAAQVTLVRGATIPRADADRYEFALFAILSGVIATGLYRRNVSIESLRL
jgi:hypothetical protein